MVDRLRICILLAILAIASACRGGPESGPAHAYDTGDASLRVAAGTEERELELEHVQEATWTENDALDATFEGPRAGLEMAFPQIGGRGVYSSNGAEVTLILDRRRFRNLDGGACTLLIETATATEVAGSLSCVGLGTHAGKGWDVGARFALSDA